jgi:hypothetical protein
MCKNSHSTKITLISIFYNQIYQTFPDLKLELLMLLSFSAMFLFMGYTNPGYAQLTTLGVKIQSLPVDNAMIKENQHSISYASSSTTASSASPLKNPPSTQSITSIFSNSYQPSQPPPIANAGSNQVVTAGSPVVLNGSNSKSPDGIILAYSWRQIPTGAPNTLSGVNSSEWEFIAPHVTANTVMRFQLNVTDNLGQIGTAFVNVLDKSTPTFSAPPPVEIKSPITSASMPSNHPNTNSNLVNLPAAKNASIPPPLTPPINH